MNELEKNLETRFGADIPELPGDIPARDLWLQLSARGSCRSFTGAPVDPALIDTLAALALASPSKSDLQQRDILILDDADTVARLKNLLAGQSWIAGAPVLMVFLANNHRQRLLHDMHEIGFANDHLDAFFNASVDAAIALSAFVIAAEAAGLGTCPISEVRNYSSEVSELLGLPDHIFAIAGLAVGWPAAPAAITPRLPLAATLHRNRYNDAGQRAAVDAYDLRRAELAPYQRQRHPELFGHAEHYGWSADKARQYATPDRADFGRFIRIKGFKLD